MDTEPDGRPGSAQWPLVPGYLNAASMGVPPRVVVAAMHADLDRWGAGAATAPGYDEDVRRARAAFARLVGVDDTHVAIGSQVSALVGLVASSLPDGARVVCPEGEFTSVVYPFLVHADRGVHVETVPLDRLADAVRTGVDLVAFSLVQSADGVRADDVAIRSAARDAGALVLADLTQAAGWLPVTASDFDVTVTGAYKWLCAPRGSAFLTAAPELTARLRPLYAGWYAAERPWASVYGSDMHLAADARRLDLSPAWHVWAGTAPAIELFADLAGPGAAEVDAVRHHGARLADTVRQGLGLPATGSPILALPDADGGLQAALEAAGCGVAARAGNVRLAFHLWNDDADARRVLEAVQPS